LGEDLEALNKRLVSVALVTDPFGNWTPESLRVSFDQAYHFKDHYICDLTAEPEKVVSRHHRRYARKALQIGQVRVVEEPLRRLDVWTELYAVLTIRHGLKGIKAFSRESFRKQLQVPGLLMLTIDSSDKPLGMLLWYLQGSVAYAHLMALNGAGYAAHAFYGLFWRSLEIFRNEFRSEVSCLHLGGASGTTAGEAEGMIEFKRGWSTGMRPAWFCGKVLEPERYSEIVRSRTLEPAPYFPLYRKGELS
jgi:hypothetical protein